MHNRDRWAFPSAKDEPLFLAMERQPLRLRDVAETFQGVITGADDVFIVELVRNEGGRALVRSRATGEEYWIETGRLAPVVRSRDVRRFERAENRYWLVLTHGEDGSPMPQQALRTDWPVTFGYLLAAKEKLMKRSKRDLARMPWYALSRPQNYRLMHAPKVLSGWKPGRPRFGLDEKGGLFFTGSSRTAGIVPREDRPSLHALLGILNSGVAETYFRVVSPEYRGGRAYSPRILEDLPLPPINDRTRALYDEIGATVQERLGIPGGTDRADALEEAVSRIVRQLYETGKPAR